MTALPLPSLDDQILAEIDAIRRRVHRLVGDVTRAHPDPRILAGVEDAASHAVAGLTGIRTLITTPKENAQWLAKHQSR